MPKCDIGHDAPEVKTAIVGGKFGQYCPTHIRQSGRGASPQYAQVYRDQDRTEFARDMLQPWDGNGNINAEFVREYPEESAELFTQEEIKKALRESV